MEDKVSIIMGVYNCEKTIDESIKSIVNQSYNNWELIICDDNSVDNTYEIALKYAKEFSDKIKLIRNERNLTLGPTLNRSLQLATGKYIARQDGDDLSNSDRLKEQILFLKNNPEVDLVSTNMVSFDKDGERGIHSLYNKFPVPTMMDLILYGSPFAHGTIMMKKSVIDSLGGYTEKWYGKQQEDYELWYRFLKNNYKGHNINKSLYYVREDRTAFKRRSGMRRLRGIYINLKIFKSEKAPIKAYMRIIKDLIGAITPKFIFDIYYKSKLQKII